MLEPAPPITQVPAPATPVPGDKESNRWNDEGMWSDNPATALGSDAYAHNAGFASSLMRAGDTSGARALRQIAFVREPGSGRRLERYTDVRAAMLSEARPISGLPAAGGARSAAPRSADAAGPNFDPLIFSASSMVTVTPRTSSALAQFGMDFAGTVGTMKAHVNATKTASQDVTWESEVRKLGWENRHNTSYGTLPISLPSSCGYTVNLTVTHTAINLLFVPINPIIESGLFEYGTRATRGTSARDEQTGCPCGGRTPPAPGPWADESKDPTTARLTFQRSPTAAPPDDSAARATAPRFSAAGVTRRVGGNLQIGIYRTVMHDPAGASAGGARAPANARLSATGGPAFDASDYGGCYSPGSSGGGNAGSGTAPARTTYCVYQDWYTADGVFMMSFLIGCFQA